MALSQTSQTVSVGGGLLDSGCDMFNANNPAVNTILADTGPLATGTYRFFLMICATALYNTNVFAVQHRDAANAATLQDFFPTNGANTTVQIQFTLEITVPNERVRFTNVAAYASLISGVLSWEKVT